MMNVFILNKLKKILKKNENNYLVKNIKNNQEDFKTEITVICIILIIGFLYAILSQKIKNSIILVIMLLTLYNTMFILTLNKKIIKFINQEISLQNAILKKNRLEMLNKKNAINRLILLDEMGNDKCVYELNKSEYIIGKNSKSCFVDIDLSGTFNEELVSRRQARIFKKENSFYITDEGSRNGTDLIKMNNRKINLRAFKEEKILIGDIISISGIKILVN